MFSLQGKFDIIINCVSAKLDFPKVLGMLSTDGVAIQVWYNIVTHTAALPALMVATAEFAKMQQNKLTAAGGGQKHFAGKPLPPFQLLCLQNSCWFDAV